MAIILAATFSAIAFLLILAFISFFARKRVMKQKRGTKVLKFTYLLFLMLTEA